MLVLVGESGAGKTTIQKILDKKYGVKKIVTYTTRPIRKGEADGKDYFFLDENEFQTFVKAGKFVEHASYRGWRYGTPVDGLDIGKAVVLTPAGLRALKARGIPHYSIYVCVDRRSRFLKLLERGDDKKEAYRRNLSDVDMFDGIADEVDFTIFNTAYMSDPEEMADRVMSQYQYWLNNHRS